MISLLLILNVLAAPYHGSDVNPARNPASKLSSNAESKIEWNGNHVCLNVMGGAARSLFITAQLGGKNYCEAGIRGAVIQFVHSDSFKALIPNESLRPVPGLAADGLMYWKLSQILIGVDNVRRIRFVRVFVTMKIASWIVKESWNGICDLLGGKSIQKFIEEAAISDSDIFLTEDCLF